MFYREAGQHKTTYAADMAVFPVLQDRIGMGVILAVAFVVPGGGAAYLGPPDILFFALFLGAAARWGLRVNWTWGAMAAMYGLLAGQDGQVPGAIKAGEHGRGAVTTGDDRDGIVSPASRERVRSFVRDWLRGLDPEPVGETTCLYTSTAGEDFILDRQGPFVICSACSGHGAKFAPLTGEIAADLAFGGISPDRRFTLAAHRG